MYVRGQDAIFGLLNPTQRTAYDTPPVLRMGAAVTIVMIIPVSVFVPIPVILDVDVMTFQVERAAIALVYRLEPAVRDVAVGIHAIFTVVDPAFPLADLEFGMEVLKGGTAAER